MEARMVNGRTATVQKGRHGAGWRFCVACGFGTRGPKEGICGNCGCLFPPRKVKDANRQGKTTRRQGKGQGTPNHIQAVQAMVQAINELGGLQEVQALIASADKLSRLGGLQEAREAVKMIQTVQDLVRGK